MMCTCGHSHRAHYAKGRTLEPMCADCFKCKGFVEATPKLIFDANADKCPECDAQWKGDDIYQYFLCQKMFPEAKFHGRYKDKTDEEIYEIAQMYGYTHEEPKYFRMLIGIEYSYGHPKHRDGISAHRCPECQTTWDRFSGEKIPEPDIGPG